MQEDSPAIPHILNNNTTRAVELGLWFDDGNVILIAESTSFEVHKSILSSKSYVFKDMFSIPQPTIMRNRYDGWSSCCLHDRHLERSCLYIAGYLWRVSVSWWIGFFSRIQQNIHLRAFGRKGVVILPSGHLGSIIWSGWAVSKSYSLPGPWSPSL